MPGGKSILKRLLLITGLLAWASHAYAALETRKIEYRDGDTLLKGYLAYDGDWEGKRPGVLVVHEWKGLNDYAKHRAEQLAALGYVAFAADMYGNGIQAKNHEEAAKLSGMFRQDRQLMRKRIAAALFALTEYPMVDTKRIGAIGYCFGGTTVLELARGGANVRGVVSFHGPLDTPAPAAPGMVKAKVLVCTGAEDPHIRPEQIAAFEKEMKAAGVEYRVIVYPGAVHSFTVPAAGNDPSQGVAYNAKADRKSWQEMTEFFTSVFSEKGRPRRDRGNPLDETSRELDSTLKKATPRGK